MSKLKIVTIIGARPQFIKASAFSRCLINYPNIEEIIIHTGQHYDYNMSEIFFKELEIPKPNFNLGIGSGSHGIQTARMIEKIEEKIIEISPDWIILYGDTNSTLAGAIAASKVPKIKIAHIESGLRSYNRKMPEEINRILTDHCSHLLFAPTMNALGILNNEGLGGKSIFSGDIMLDSTLHNLSLTEKKVFDVPSYPFFLATIHRQENTENLDKLLSIFKIFSSFDTKVIIPLHPRIKSKIKDFPTFKNILFVDPMGPLLFLKHLQNAKLILTDSGGVQKEAFFLKKPCITLREETEWVETLESGWNILAGLDEVKIKDAVQTSLKESSKTNKKYFGEGDASKIIIESIIEYGK